MSMRMLTCIQIAWSFAAYTLVVLGLPWLVLHKRLINLPTEDRWMGYFLSGNFYIINLVFALQFLHISNRVTLLLGTVLPFATPYLLKHRVILNNWIRHIQKRVLQYLQGERTVKTMLRQRCGYMDHSAYRKILRWMKKNGLELVCVVILAGAIFYEYGLGTILAYGYKASDTVVHNYWINLMDANQIFHAGVYPHGFHCMIYYLEQMFEIPTYVLLRVMSVIQTFYIHLMALLMLRALCKSRYMPYLGVWCYVMLSCIGSNTYLRYTSALPQEYGMLFIIPSGFFAIRFFQDFKPKQAELNAEEKKVLDKIVQWDLIFFAISFSLSITVHFYDTMIAGLFCTAIALAYWKEFLNWKYFWRIISVGILSIFFAALPMAIGVMQGNKLQGSLYWGLNIINGQSSEETESASTSDKTTGTLPETETLPQSYSVLQGLYRRVHIDAVGVGTNNSDKIACGMIAGGWVLLFLGMLHFLWKHDGTQAGILLTIGWFDILLLLMFDASQLHFPQIMDTGRSSIFFTYAQVLVWPMILDGIISLPSQKLINRRGLDAVSFLLLIIIAGTGISLQGMRGMVGNSQLFESNQAMTCTANIIRENEQFDWTICSANEERQMILSVGRHEELITFLRTLKKSTESAVSLKIPTHYIYFYVEKTPIPYAGVLTEKKENKISEKDAEQPLNMESGLTPYEGENRWVTMAHIYYWVQAFQKLHPDAIDVYYEDDEFVCYKLTQNVDSLYELAIDYGYNE